MSASRRVPLASIPNATNSPHRTLTNSNKRPRASANVLQQENEPLHKRQMVEKLQDSTVPPSPRRRTTTQSAEGRVFESGPATAETNAFQRRLVAAREKAAPVKAAKNDLQQQKESENIRQWQRHYRKIFPTFSFYFESIPEDMRARFARQVTALGAREEKFFSKTVTHIVTTRSIPPEAPGSSSSNSASDLNSHQDAQPQTINPLLLAKNPAQISTGSRLPAPIQGNGTAQREAPSSTDILVRGRQMGMKIWASEKFQRILASILESTDAHGHNTRGHNGTQSTTRHQQEDLSQVLRKEKLGSERDSASLLRDVVAFKGPFIYIHDIDEKVRPTMVRDFSKPKCKGDGEWPQFRTSGAGKCPFVEDMSMRRDMEQERKAQRLQQQEEQAQLQAPRTRSMVEAKMEPPRRTSPRKALQEVRNFTAGPALVSNNAPAKPVGPPAVERQSSMPTVFARHANAPMKPPSLQFGGEPAASGIQRSNLTSAIQSQMISSTAAAPGGKATTSKEVNELKRKVLERTHTGSLSMGSVNSINSIPSSHRMTDLAGALKNARAPAPQRAAKSAAKEKLGGIPEDNDPYADDMAAERALNAPKKAAKKPAKKEAKPGYCENCRDKYDDFEEHTISRKHRKFAMTSSNWIELDELLSKIQS